MSVLSIAASVLFALAPAVSAHPNGQTVTPVGAGGVTVGYVVVTDFHFGQSHCRRTQIFLETDGQSGWSSGDLLVYDQTGSAPGTNNPCPIP